jgi:hypothetical protein
MASRRRTQAFRGHALAVFPFCLWCGRPLTAATATADHLLARSQGGGDDWANLGLACARCNSARGDRPAGRPPLGPVWAAAAWWVAWTRYPGGRWRATLRTLSPPSVNGGPCASTRPARSSPCRWAPPRYDPAPAVHGPPGWGPKNVVNPLLFRPSR